MVTASAARLASCGRSSSASLHGGASHPGRGEQRFLGSAVLPCPAALAGPCMHLSVLGERSCLGGPPVTSTSARSAAGPLLPVYGGRWEVTANNQMPCPPTAYQRHACPALCLLSSQGSQTSFLKMNEVLHLTVSL